MYPFRTRKPLSRVVSGARALPCPTKLPANSQKADARTRTEDPFITRERPVRDARPLKGTRGHVLPGIWALSCL
jgi:hypothetical protein